MSALDEILATITKNCSTVSAFGKKIKLSIDGNIIHIDGTTTPPTVSKNDDPADATISATEDVFRKVINKEINPQMAFMSGKIKLQGDMMAAMSLQKIFG